ncbi:MAG: hypothetical protein ACLFTK_06610 [Anaerolineales bacterium]
MTEQPSPDKQSRSLGARFNQLSIFEKTALAIGAVAAVFLLSLIIALFVGIVLGDAEEVADLIAIVRDLFIILLVLQGMIITLALTVLILQLASITNLLQNELYPIVKNLQDTSNTVKGTAAFISENAAAPVIELSAWVGGLTTFMRNLRNVARGNPPTDVDGVAATDNNTPEKKDDIKAKDHDGESAKTTP